MPGSITLIDSFDQGYFEVHINAQHAACKSHCHHICGMCTWRVSDEYLQWV